MSNPSSDSATAAHHHRTGGCECGAVRFSVDGPVRGVITCWCGQCHRLHGAAAPHTQARWADITFDADAGLAWFETSAGARRAFCADCGARLFFEETADTRDGLVSIVAGAFDAPTRLRMAGHIFTDDAPAHADIAAIDDDLPKYPQGWTGPRLGLTD